MANPEHLAILKQGVAVWNEWRKRNPGVIYPELSGADLTGAELQGVDLVAAKLKGANFHGVKLSKADLHNADLEDANLSGAHLIEADLHRARLNNAKISLAHLRKANLNTAELKLSDFLGADLSEADLVWANLVGSNLFRANLSRAKLRLADLSSANLWGANLSDADLTEVIVSWTSFSNVDLSVVKGLETLIHLGPSTIGIDTIYRSKGKIPEVFLRGCGVPDAFIEFSCSLVVKPIEFYSCFISHSNKDKTFCERLYADLQAKGVRVWYFPEDAKWGESVWGEIDRNIRIYDKLVVVCSRNSLTSGPVLREIERALRREDEERKNILFPVTIDDYIFNEWEHPRKADVLAKIVGDFRGWNRSADSYDAAFKKLPRALKAGQ